MTSNRNKGVRMRPGALEPIDLLAKEKSGQASFGVLGLRWHCAGKIGSEKWGVGVVKCSGSTGNHPPARRGQRAGHRRPILRPLDPRLGWAAGGD